MQISILKKPWAFALALITGTQIVNTAKLPMPIIFFPKHMFSYLTFLLVSYFYTRISKFTFSNSFILISLLYHFILFIALPALTIFIFNGLRIVNLAYASLTGFEGSALDMFVRTIVTLLFNYFLMFICCKVGNFLAMRHRAKDTAPITFLGNPVLFAGLFIFALFIINSALVTSLIQADNAGNAVVTIPLSPWTAALLITIKPASAATGLFILGLWALFIVIFSFVYTCFSQTRMTKKFKFRSLLAIIALLFLLICKYIFFNVMIRYYFFEYVESLNSVEKINMIVDSLLNLKLIFVLVITYFLITAGNILALKYLHKKQNTY